MVRNSDFSLPDLPKAGGGPVRAAQYLRMSTEHQKYSTENQSDEIQLYAARNEFEIVRTYTDEGKSGLRLDGRISAPPTGRAVSASRFGAIDASLGTAIAGIWRAQFHATRRGS